MDQPRFKIIPVRGSVRFDAPVALGVLLRSTPPAPKIPGFIKKAE